MSWWTKIRNTVESPIKWIQNESGGIWNKITGRPSAAQTRVQQQQIENQVKDQVKAYQDQTNLERQELADARNAQDVQKRQIQEKQIRSMRRSYSAPRSGSGGLLGQGQPVSDDVNTQLGG
jgi:hypothetical protein